MDSESGLKEHKQIFRVTGMHCAGCVRRIETAIAQVSGVRSASVNLATREAQVSFE